MLRSIYKESLGPGLILYVLIHLNMYIYCNIIFFFNLHCNPRGLWPAQLSFSILSRKVFTECRCQRHVKPPTWRTNVWNVPTSATRCPPRLKRQEQTPAAEGGTMGEKVAENFAESGDFHVTFGFFYMP